MTDQQNAEMNELTPEQAQQTIQAIEEVERQEAEDQARNAGSNAG